jgi:hypothetical protein
VNLSTLLRHAALIALLLHSFPKHAWGQETSTSSGGAGWAILGGVGGIVAGGYVGLAFTAARAQTGRFLYSESDFLKTTALFAVPGAAVGAYLGATDSDALGRAALGSLVGAVGGGAIGAMLGRMTSRTAEGTFAGGVIGAGVGILAGAVIGVLADGGSGSSPGATQSVRTGVPLGVRLHF